MAEEQAEWAFLQSMQEEEPAATQENEEYEPEAVEDSAAHAVQPKTIGGFVMEDDEDDDDDEEEEDQPTAENHHVASPNGILNIERGSSNTPQHTLVKSPHDSNPSIDLPVQSTEQGFAGGASPTGIPDPVPNLAHALSNVSASQSSVKSPITVPEPPASASHDSVPVTKGRLPYDRVGMLEDRIKEDPRGDVDAWLSLISDYKKRNKVDDLRNTYERFLKVFPACAAQWVAYINNELEIEDFERAEQLFNKALPLVPNLELWSTYLNYIRRRNDLTTDYSGNARQILAQVYDFVLQNVGIDKDSGQIWEDYVQFVRSGPGQLGGSTWQDQQKMDQTRKALQKAVSIPHQSVNKIWKEYTQFEETYNKTTGRRFLGEKSPVFMNARSTEMELNNLTKGLKRTTMPSLPPAPGFEGDVEYTRQVELWKTWINREKEDPLSLKQEDETAFRTRVLFTYKQALMALRFWPEMWFEAAEFCFENNLDSEGTDFLSQGASANPESCLLAFKHADRIETNTTNDDNAESSKRRGEAVREPYDKVILTLYGLIDQAKKRETQAVAQLKERFSNENAASPSGSNNGDQEDQTVSTSLTEASQKAQIEAVQNGIQAQIKLLSKTISFSWIALMRAMRRVQGKGTGKADDPNPGMRGIFTEARKAGRLTSDFWVATALMEHHCYREPVATKIFERTAKLFPEDEALALAYMKHLIAINDTTNARAVFETTVERLTQNPVLVQKAKPLYLFYHEYESHYGDLKQMKGLEKRMRELFPEDPDLALFAKRYSTTAFDPTAIRPIVSPSTQAKPKILMPSIENVPSLQESPHLPIVQPPPTIPSPKRPIEESDNDSVQPRPKIPRAESPLKGAAGRRLESAQKRTALRNELNQSSAQSITPLPTQPSLPREVMYLLSILPRAETYKATVLIPERMVELMRNVDLDKAPARGQATAAQPPVQYGYGQPAPLYNYGR